MRIHSLMLQIFGFKEDPPSTLIFLSGLFLHLRLKKEEEWEDEMKKGKIGFYILSTT